ncbi:MAG TPA: ABC transporter ATP-binding protein [Polyangiaceae bacterium]|nr:ABC transporter ATP-binding protein [Polyangiaceae bacterium]HNZ21952.1 ABC transporter ATP-binding protein [Polyangiaceae bacterium]HOD23137.1 ABC transporter ATP-binding protein [Polyangiaceae bacterium]HOE50329.1 ABC transporter ATP-binding protein [Polyangiaceae bacterium]HOH00573.1 ABC transporter ATP-binding protein [Polyangiaceae bacterium]
MNGVFVGSEAGRPSTSVLSGTVMIEVRNLFKYYGQRRAVGPLSFSIAPGEIVGLLGLNGAGKTTVLRVLACDLLPSAGTVTVDGIDVVDQPQQVRHRIGYLPDTPPVYAEMGVHEYLVFAARLRGLTTQEAHRRATEAEKVTNLEKVAHDPIHSLSHGFKQRVGIAQALVHRPKLLLLDEPILGLDPVQIVEMRHLLRSLRGDFTIVLSSHNLKEISETCDRLLVIREGSIVASGSEAELSSKLLQTTSVEITFSGDHERVERVVRDKDGVRSVALHPSPEDPGNHVLRVDADRDIRPELVRTLVAAEVDVLQVVQAKGELESIFLRLAGDVSAAGNDDPACDGSNPESPSQQDRAMNGIEPHDSTDKKVDKEED